MRETIGKNMSASKSNAPHFYLTMEINMTQATSFRASINESQTDFKYSFNDFIIKAVGLALKKHKYLNGSFVDNHIILFKRIDVGVAVALDEGLITPVIRNCDQKSLKEIALDFRELAKRAKRKKLKPEEYKNSTFTISNLGMYGIEEFSAIINPPEAAILAVGEIKNQPVVENHEIVIGSTMKLTLSCDHRIVDGVTGSLFLREIKKSLENPTSLTS
jgi:pyruvate dehydrogenase E2 component (dihydrolipoamide acetyltransferase)